jgi:hypothetical protein
MADQGSSGGASRFGGRAHTAGAVLVALLVGSLLGPPAVSAAASKLNVYVKNWPKMPWSVYVKNWPAMPWQVNVVSGPAKTPVSVQLAWDMDTGDTQDDRLVYTVPTGKWLVVTEASLYGNNASTDGPLIYAFLIGSDSFRVSMDLTKTGETAGSTFWQSSHTVEWRLPPGATISLSVMRASPTVNRSYGAFLIHGYLVDKP